MRVFESFAQADSSDKRQKGGTGLGLFIVKQIVERFGGKVGFESAAGQGALFFVDLPRCKGERGEDKPDTAGQNRKIIDRADTQEVA